VLLALVAVAIFARPARAQNRDQERNVSIVVQDTKDKLPVSGAVVTLSIFQSVSYLRRSTTDADGNAIFVDVPLGFLVIKVEKPGYTSAETTLHLTIGQAGALVAVSLTGLRTIATVKSTSSVRYLVYGPDATFAPLFRDLAAQMTALGGADIRLSPSGTLSSVSLEGADPSLTSTTFDGVEVQSAAALDSIDVDSLSRATVDLSGTAVNFMSLTPAPYLETDLRSSAGGIGDSQIGAEQRGTAGSTGYAFQFTGHSARSALGGQTYPDTSGFSYKHTGQFLGGLGAAAVSVPIGQAVFLTGKYIRHISRSQPLEVIEPGNILQGYGPFPVSSVDDGAIDEIAIHAEVGTWQTGINFTDFSTRGTGDFSNAFVGTVPSPSTSSHFSNEADLVLTAIRASSHDQTLNINLLSSTLKDDQRSTFDNASNLSSIASKRASLMLDYNSYYNGGASFFDFQGQVEHDGASGQVAPKITAYVRRKIRSGGALFGSLAVGSELALAPSAATFALPNEVQYNCSAGTAVSIAPNDSPSVPRGLEARVGLTRGFARSSFSVQVYDRRYSGVTLSAALVPAALEPQGFAPPSILNGILSGFSTFGGCNPPIDPVVYFQHDVSGVGVDYRGIEIGVGGPVGRLGTYQVTLSDHQSTLISADARLKGALSTYIPSTQIPGVPPINASASIEFPMGVRLRALLNETFVSKNNAYHLPSYGLVTIGVVGKLSDAASFTIVATNVSHRFPGAFASSRYAVPIPTVGGDPFLTLATPLSVPELFVGLHFKTSREPSF